MRGFVRFGYRIIRKLPFLQIRLKENNDGQNQFLNLKRTPWLTVKEETQLFPTENPLQSPYKKDSHYTEPAAQFNVFYLQSLSQKTTISA